MATNIINQSQTVNKTTKKVEQEIKNTVQNINIDLSSLDMSGAIDSFARLEAVAKSADFGAFMEKIVALKDVFADFQKSVKSANTSITNFANSSDKLAGGNTAVVQNIEVDASSVANGVANVSSSVGSMAESIGGAAANVGGCFAEMSGAVSAFGGAVSGIIDSLAGLLEGVDSLGSGMLKTSEGLKAMVPVLPALGAAMLAMAANMSGITAYLPELLIFSAVLLALSLMGAGLAAAGAGLMGIGAGLVSMTEGMAALIAFMPVFIESLAGITENVGGILLFVLLAASVLVMAIALEKMNEQLSTFVESMNKLSSLMSLGFVAAFTAFALMLVMMSMFADKVAKGMDKVTSAMAKQITRLTVLNPLLAAQAILTNPIVGAITVAAALAGSLLVSALLPKMATGGVVSAPTVALVGEGRYPEAVVPLGDSPQFTDMKTEIAGAVITALAAMNRGATVSGSNSEVVLNVDGAKLARVIIPQINREQRRKGISAAVREV